MTTTSIVTFADLTAAIDVVVDAHYADQSASAAKRGKNPKFPYVPVIKRKTGMYSGTATTNPTRNRAYATREEAIAEAQRHLDHYRVQMAHNLLKPSHGADREWRGLPRDITAQLAEVGKLDVPSGTRVTMTWGKHRGEQGQITLVSTKLHTHCIMLDNDTFLSDIEAVDFVPATA